MSIESAQKVFQDVFVRFTRGWNAISALRQAAEVGLPTAEQHLFPDYLRFVGTLTKPQSPGDSPVLAGAKPGDLDLIARETARGIVRSAESGVNAAIAVFAHSVIDAAAFGYCRATRIADPEAWVSLIEKRRIELANVRGVPYETVRDRLLDSYFDQIERESLLVKVDLLHARCQPAPGWSPMGSYKFDRQVLERLDQLRHDIIHSDALLKQVPKFGLESTDYLMKTCWYFMGLVNKRYSLRLDISNFLGIPGTP